MQATDLSNKYVIQMCPCILQILYFSSFLHGKLLTLVLFTILVYFQFIGIFLRVKKRFQEPIVYCQCIRKDCSVIYLFCFSQDNQIMKSLSEQTCICSFSNSYMTPIEINMFYYLLWTFALLQSQEPPLLYSLWRRT